ncbi:hypothetical protein VCHA31O73_360028 [Vibrio chagasii]|nr:hypothetical protein VCHA31O73_360028 [Vibrio chagasii]
MDIKTTITNANLIDLPPLEPLTIYEAAMKPLASVWASLRRALAKNREVGARIRQKRLITAMERDIVTQIKAVPGVTVYETDNNGNRYKVSLLDGFIQDELIGVAYNLPQAPREHAAIVVDLISFEEYSQAHNAEKNGNHKHFEEWETMASMFAQCANVDKAVLMLLCPRTGDLISRIVERDDSKVSNRLDELTGIMEAEGVPPYVRNSLGVNPVSAHCRTCFNCNPIEGGKWVCTENLESGDGVLLINHQAMKHPCHIVHPSFIPLKLLEQPERGASWYETECGLTVEILSDKVFDHGGNSLCDKTIRSSEACALSGEAAFFSDQNIDKFKSDYAGKVE